MHTKLFVTLTKLFVTLIIMQMSFLFFLRCHQSNTLHKGEFNPTSGWDTSQSMCTNTASSSVYGVIGTLNQSLVGSEVIWVNPKCLCARTWMLCNIKRKKSLICILFGLKKNCLPKWWTLPHKVFNTPLWDIYDLVILVTKWVRN